MPKPLRCKTCESPINGQDSPLAYMASRINLCADCYTARAEAQLLMRHVTRVRRCEHLWSDWDVMDLEDGSDECVFVRQCDLCHTFTTVYGQEVPPENPEYDISWCTLD